MFHHDPFHIKKMKILIVNNTVIPANQYGGTERIIWWLGKELVRLGHKVKYLVAQGSSCPFAEVFFLDKEKTLNEQIPEYIDLVHLHFQPEEKINKPYLVTHHGNYFSEEKFDINTVFVSRNHAGRNGSQAFVYNGIDIEDYGSVDFAYEREHLLFLGYAKRPEKNLRDCSYIARKTNNVLAIVGGKYKWFKWRPWLDYKGFLGGKSKNKILQKSKALLFPVRWHEPFGLAVIESLYFGAPVFGSQYGALPELVVEDVGFLSNSRKELVEAVRALDRFNAKKCHDYVCDLFTSKQMTVNYLDFYKKVLDGSTINPFLPARGENFFRETLLPFNI